MIFICLYLLSLSFKDIAALTVNKSFNSSKAFSKRQVRASCDKGWYPFEDKCYRTGGTQELKLSWDRASERCKELGGKLASIHSKELSDFLTAFILMNVEHTAWIGLNDRGTESHYKWEDGTELDFINWLPGQPSAAEVEKEDCVESVYYTYPHIPLGKPGQWNDHECYHEKEFICQKNTKRNQARKFTDPRFCPPRIGGWRLRTSCYHVIEKKLTWQEAEDYCIETHNGHLVTINDFSVNLFIEYILRNYTEDMWIGIKMKNEFQQQWSSGWYVAFTNWTDEPGEFLEGMCALRTLDQWRTTSCQRRLPFVCETATKAAPSLSSSEELFCPEEPVGWRNFGGEYCYYINTDHLTWYEANFRCIRRGGTLASFHSQMEMDILQPFLMIHFLKSRIYPWIGLHRHMLHEEEFVWVDGTPMDFKAWAVNEPNSEKEQCADVKVESMTWGDYFCNHPRPSICSIRKISSIKSTGNEIATPPCTCGFSTEVLLGVVFCILLVSLLLGIIIYYLSRQGKVKQQIRKASRISLPPHLRRRHKSSLDKGIVITDDDYENYEKPK
ncbi:macrophage mannose receptor 1 isoform X1 [Parasteatoda tepidariorum]|uniref:macrophage mannose receptor 1 isoform X1 n=2 Tax=Parasteatoda tepidariorum TaxID=114398 RepID=UPI001C72255E|nr:macrophage mannose receptor 1 [Parasteatoda tepidariorum]